MIQPLNQGNSSARTGKPGNTNNNSQQEAIRYTNAGDIGPADLVSSSQLSRMTRSELEHMIAADFIGGNEEEAYNASMAQDELSRRVSTK